MLALHSATCLPSCSIVGVISTRSSAYRNSEGRHHLSPHRRQHPWQQQTTVDLVLTLDATIPSFLNTSHHFPWDSIKFLFEIHKSIVQLLLCLVFLLYLSHDENGSSGSLARHEAKLHVINWHIFISCSSNLIVLYEQHTSGSLFLLYTGTRLMVVFITRYHWLDYTYFYIGLYMFHCQNGLLELLWYMVMLIIHVWINCVWGATSNHADVIFFT